MGSRIVKVFYDQSCYPFKDSERTIRYPITGSSFAGSSNVNELHFYVRDIGRVNNLSWVAIVKLPNGKILYQLLNDIHLDSEINEYYITFNLSSFYTQLKGDIYISLNGCMGQVEIEPILDDNDDPTGVSTIQGEIDSRTVVATGAVKFSINYAPQRPIGFSFELDQYQTIIDALSNKANVFNTIQVVDDIQDIDSANYNAGQLFYDLETQEYYQLNEYGAFVQVLLDTKHHLNRYEVTRNATTLLQLHNLFGERLVVLNEKLFQLSNYGNSKTNVSAFDLETHEYYFVEDANISNYLSQVLTLENSFTYRKTTSEQNVVYATDSGGDDTEIEYSANVENNAIVQRDASGQVKVPLSPSANADSTSKKYVDDLISSVKANAFIMVDTTTYPTRDSFIASTGEEGYIYLYPINISDLTKGYYQYIWEGSSWLDIGTTQIDLSNYVTKARRIAGITLENDITANELQDALPKTSVITIEYGDNLFNPKTAVTGKYIHSAYENVGETLDMVTDNQYLAYNRVEIENGKTYSFSLISHRSFVTDENNVILQTIANTNDETTFTVNAIGAKYLYINYNFTTKPTNQFMVVEGPTMPSTYKQYIDNVYFNENNPYLGKDSIKIVGKNIFTYLPLNEGKYYYAQYVNSTCTLESNSAFNCVLVPVEYGKTYSFTGASFAINFLDVNLKCLQIVQPASVTFPYTFTITNPSIVYVTISYRPAVYPTETFMVVEGQYPSTYFSGTKYAFNGSSIYVEKNENIYYVGPTREHTSLMDLFVELKDDISEKTIYIDEGTYDIFEELGGEEFADTIDDDQWESHSTFIPRNTRLIGLGNVILNFLPTAEETNSYAAACLSPLNVQGGDCYIENIIINCDNCRYGIHDEIANDDETYRENYKHIYKNVYVNKVKTTYGNYAAFGCGYGKGSYFEFEDCYFSSDATYTFVIHSNYGSALININNCIIALGSSDGTHGSIEFGTSIADTSTNPTRVFMSSCNIDYAISFKASSGQVNKTQIYCNNCGNPNIILVDGVTNNYIPKIYDMKLENIVDKDYHKRFIEGSITMNTITGVTQTYGRWSLSGTHLMLIIGFNVANGSTINAWQTLAQITLPSWVFSKISVLWGDNVAETSIRLRASNNSAQNLSCFLQKGSTTLNILNDASTLTLTGDRSGRILFDLLIDDN